MIKMTLSEKIREIDKLIEKYPDKNFLKELKKDYERKQKPKTDRA